MPGGRVVTPGCQIGYMAYWLSSIGVLTKTKTRRHPPTDQIRHRPDYDYLSKQYESKITCTVRALPGRRLSDASGGGFSGIKGCTPSTASQCGTTLTAMGGRGSFEARMSCAQGGGARLHSLAMVEQPPRVTLWRVESFTLAGWGSGRKASRCKAGLYKTKERGRRKGYTRFNGGWWSEKGFVCRRRSKAPAARSPYRQFDLRLLLVEQPGLPRHLRDVAVQVAFESKL
jgi:hypothetical protein